MPSNKKRERLFIVVCVKVAENRLLLQGKIKTLGLIFSHETAGLLASFTTISKSLIHIRTLISGCSTNPVGEKSPTGFFICKKEKSRL